MNKSLDASEVKICQRFFMTFRILKVLKDIRCSEMIDIVSYFNKVQNDYIEKCYKSINCS